MRRVVYQSDCPAAVAHNLCRVLQSFPAAAVGGVRWDVLSRKYEERYSTCLDIAALGHSSALAAAAALLWDGGRLVNTEDIDNPVVAVENIVALTPMPGFLACWPSLYRTFCEIVQSYGSSDDVDAKGDDESSCSLLLSKLKPLLQMHWHVDFNESGLTYFSEEGTRLTLKKMKHLVQAVLRWRNQSLNANLEGEPCDDIMKVLTPCLEMVPSKKNNDLVLRFATRKADIPLIKPHQLILEAVTERKQPLGEDGDSISEKSSFSSGCSPKQSINGELLDEIVRLRKENAALRGEGEMLQKQADNALMFTELFATPAIAQPSYTREVFDDPFEPPPETLSPWDTCTSLSGSTNAPSEFSLDSGNATPASAMSGVATPMQFTFAGPCPMNHGAPSQICPKWLLCGDHMRIPNGIVQQSRELFERNISIPSFFVHQ